MDDDLRHLEADRGKQHELDSMDIDLVAEVLFELVKKKVLEIVFTGQIRRKPEESDAADHQQRKKGDDHSC
jgi:DUF1009 family protein